MLHEGQVLGIDRVDTCFCTAFGVNAAVATEYISFVREVVADAEFDELVHCRLHVPSRFFLASFHDGVDLRHTSLDRICQ